MRPRMPRTALFPTIALGCLGLFLVLSAWTAQMATPGETMESDGRKTSQRAGQYWTVLDVHPGDVVVLSFGTTSLVDRAAPYLHIVALEGGEAGPFLAGGTLQHVLFQTEYKESADPGHYSPLDVRFTRPDVYDGKPHAQTLNGDLYGSVDILVYEDRPPAMSETAWNGLVDAPASAWRNSDIVVAHQPWVGLQWAWYAGMAASAVAAVVGLVGLARRRPSPPPEGARGELSGLLSLQGQAMGFLRSLRMTMATAGAILLVGGAASLVALNALAEWGRYDPFGGWLFVIMGLGFLTYGLALSVWFVQYRRIAREYRRWAATPSPVDA